MKPVRKLIEKFRHSDGRAKVRTTIGILAVSAAVALVLGVLPAFAASVPGVQVNWGGGSGACQDALVPLQGGAARGPSAARNELWVQNPKSGQTYTGSDGTKFTLRVYESDTKVDITMLNPSGKVFYDVVINGGKKSNHYDFDNNAPAVFKSQDTGFMAPEKDNQTGVYHKISHINVCYDLQPTVFECNGDPEDAVLLGEGVGVKFNFTDVSASIFTTSDATCDVETKVGFFFKDNTEQGTNKPDVLLAFGDEGFVAGRMDITKEYMDPNDFDPLRYYDVDDPVNAVEVSWCDVVPKETGDGDQFDDFLGTEMFPDASNAQALNDGNVACKVAELEYANGVQETILYILFKDPRFY